ncbi:MAG: sulfide/dihydroorotate dehydrogenase-like FAD/NAD-binding protein [Candidatus Zixiibacteriota bacterium]|nr:MAG: sulfide/dihydroorotate dehydrogenase-like FAD/NAD-binding protein [candidate division Zixibacteria bacterium]
MFKVVTSRMIVPNMHLLTLEAPAVAREAKPGQFVIIRAEEEGERIPLSISDWDEQMGTITIVYMNVGRTTDRLASLVEGQEIPTVVGPLGNATDIEKYGTVLLVGGCYGIGSIFPIARALKEAGNKIVVLIEGRSSYLFYWEDRYKAIADKFVQITRDGTKGYKGHVDRLPEIIKSLDTPVDRVIVNGCTYCLKRVSDATRPMEIPTWVSLNPIMIDGTGMCGVCRVSVGGETRFACVHGPDFDGHQVNWEELLQRRKTYMPEEVVPLRTSKSEEHPHQHREGCHG